MLMTMSMLAGGVATWLLTPGSPSADVVEREGTSWVALPFTGQLDGSASDAVGDTLDSVVRLSVNNRSSTTVGTAVIIRTSGYAVTSSSLVENSTRAMLSLSTDDYRFAQVVGIDRATGLALLRFETTAPAPAAVLSNIADLRPQTDVVVLRGTRTHPVAKLAELAVLGTGNQRIELTLANPTDFLGSPVLGSNGTVMGIATHTTGANLGVVPINVVSRVANTLLRDQN